jgi:hypothetical protein
MAELGELTFSHTNDAGLVVHLAGSWRLQRALPDPSALEAELESYPQPKEVLFDTSRLAAWDTGILTFLTRVTELGVFRGVAVDRRGLPPEVQRLLTLAEAVPEKEDARATQADESPLERIGARSRHGPQHPGGHRDQRGPRQAERRRGRPGQPKWVADVIDLGFRGQLLRMCFASSGTPPARPSWSSAGASGIWRPGR